ncbi:MAG: transcription antitermination factor NusB [Bdellovibrionales bacterium]|nr:transcription antitermination factor NusB [Bdellovibrionales bacterium]
MKSRRLARESVLQSLYQFDSCGSWCHEDVDFFFSHFFQSENFHSGGTPELKVRAQQKTESENRAFARKIVLGVLDNLSTVDEIIEKSATHWNIERMARVDRNILRLAVYELGFLEEVPSRVSINEAIEIAKRYGADDSPNFINGVLDRAARILAEKPLEKPQTQSVANG